MADRDLQLNLSAKLKPNGDEGLKRIQSTLKNLGAQAGTAFRDYNLALKESEKAEAALEKAMRSRTTRGTANLAKLAEAARKANTELEKTRKQLEKAVPGAGWRRIFGMPGGSEGGGGAASGLLGGGMGGMMSALSLAAAAAIGGKIAESIARIVPGQRISDYNTLPGTTFGVSNLGQEKAKLEAKAAVREFLLGWIPGSSGIILQTAREADKQNSPVAYIEEDLRNQQQALRLQMARATNLSQRDLATKRLSNELFHFEALRQGGMSPLPQQARIWERGQERLDKALQQIQSGHDPQARKEREKKRFEDALNNPFKKVAPEIPAGGAGYDRISAQRDLAGTIAHSVTLAQHDAETKLQQFIIGRERAVSGADVQKAKRGVEKQQQQVKSAQLNVAQGGNQESQLRRRMALEQSLFGLKEAQRVLDDAMAHDRQLAIQQGERLNAQGEQRLRIVQQEAERLRGIRREEMEKETSRREHFGLLHPMRQRTAVGVARKLNMGLNPTTRDITIMQSMPEIFGERLRRFGMERTGAGSAYAELRQLLPELGKRQQAAEKALGQINQQFHVQIQLNEKDVASQLVKEIMPAIRQAIGGVKSHFETEQQRQMNERWLTEQHQFGGS